MKNSTILEVNIDNFFHNVEKVQEYIGDKVIMPIVKAHGYGTYLNKRLEVINKFDMIAVAKVDEAIYLRNMGYQKEIFILNQPAITELEEIYKHNLIIGLSEKNFLDQIKKPLRVHLELETGMNRTGIKSNDLEEFITKIKNNSNIIVEGVYTHLSSADFDKEYTLKQLELFKTGVAKVKENFAIKYIHSSASNGLLNYDDGISNMVRPGIILYGYPSDSNTKNKIDIKPTTTLRTKITYIKDIGPNEAISYGQKFISTKPMKVATIPIGYADGYKRALTNQGEVIINGKKCNILGAVCMDSCMVDVTDIDAKVGDNVYLWDNNQVTLENIAKKCDTINYEILCTISSRVTRKFIKDGILDE